MTMLSYSKIVLEKVSFDRRLFLKEYRKMHRWMSPEEVQLFRRWARFRMSQATK
jgi:hypothetical protein